MDGIFERDLFGHASTADCSASAMFPDAAGFKGEAETGREAAADIGPKLGRLQNLVLEMAKGCGPRGLTPEEACDLSGMERVTLQPRFSELKVKGLLVDSGQRRLNPSSRKRAVVWVAVEHLIEPEGPSDGNGA